MSIRQCIECDENYKADETKKLESVLQMMCDDCRAKNATITILIKAE